MQGFEQRGYVTDRALATSVYLLIKLRKPLLIEGHAGLGKTEVAKVLAAMLGTRLIRLQCYEGLDVSSAVYEWNYQKQLLAIKIHEGTQHTVEEKEKHIFSKEFLLERPLLQSILAEDVSPVLLIDEIDRADEAFEAFLLELLSDFQISVPEMGTIQAKHIPYVILTSNRTRELSDALRRRSDIRRGILRGPEQIACGIGTGPAGSASAACRAPATPGAPTPGKPMKGARHSRGAGSRPATAPLPRPPSARLRRSRTAAARAGRRGRSPRAAMRAFPPRPRIRPRSPECGGR